MSIVAPQSKSNLTSSPVWIRRCPGQRGFVAAISWQSRGQKNFCKATLVEKKNEQKRQHGVFKSCQKWKNKIQNAFTRHTETFISTNATKLINVPQKWRLLISINPLTVTKLVIQLHFRTVSQTHGRPFHSPKYNRKAAIHLFLICMAVRLEWTNCHTFVSYLYGSKAWVD